MGLVWRFTKREGAIKIILKTIEYVLTKPLQSNSGFPGESTKLTCCHRRRLKTYEKTRPWRYNY